MPSLDDRICDSVLGRKLGLNNLDRKIKSTSHVNSILNSIVQFVPARKLYEDESKELKAKYVRLRARKIVGNGYTSHAVSHPSTSNITTPIGTSIPTKILSPPSGIPPPLFDIFPADGVKLNWDAKLKRSTAVGLHNLGNTCFLNSVLQILTNTAPLTNYLLGGDHSTSHCPSSTGFCALCLMRNHVQRVFSASSGGAVAPSAVVQRVRCFMKSYSMGRQEDAHEFLRYFIDSMQTAALYAHKGKKLDLHTKETSVIGRIFGGYLKNEVTCNKCRYSSITYDPFLDISVEVKQLHTLEAALAHFTRPETLANENAYKCPKCKLRVSARKMFTIHQAPNILTIQLKRFDHMNKIDRHIPYPERLSLRPYMTEKQGPPVNYKLYGVVVHHGRSTRSGHYYSFVRNPCDQWHVLDDSRAASVSPNSALKSSGAYLLFYIRTPTPVAAVKPQVNTTPLPRLVQANGKTSSPSPFLATDPSTSSVMKPQASMGKLYRPFSPVTRVEANGVTEMNGIHTSSPQEVLQNGMKESPEKECHSSHRPERMENGLNGKVGNGKHENGDRKFLPKLITTDSMENKPAHSPSTSMQPLLSPDKSQRRKEKLEKKKKRKEERSNLAVAVDSVMKKLKRKKRRKAKRYFETVGQPSSSTGNGEIEEKRALGDQSGTQSNGGECCKFTNDERVSISPKRKKRQRSLNPFENGNEVLQRVKGQHEDQSVPVKKNDDADAIQRRKKLKRLKRKLRKKHRLLKDSADQCRLGNGHDVQKLIDNGGTHPSNGHQSILQQSSLPKRKRRLLEECSLFGHAGKKIKFANCS